jgi:RES domain-containing protein
MRLWRLARKAFAKEPLSGEGGLYASGRWHSAPRLVVYASESLALASLEVLVHFDPDLSPRDLVALEIEVPANVPLARWTCRIAQVVAALSAPTDTPETGQCLARRPDGCRALRAVGTRAQ